ncbi:hypothetical protein BMW22_29670 (plasmid) [Rhizobium leguminosarum]|uniref:Uncharacterized protein n=1 Tax=Rhizobium leguminosarum TaxID=384 RepID=A0A1L3ZJ27_RHILE|nr:hypothetical protein [Rhizobium leguminosarum]API55644.1 hypothetical protein BMW22_29670 [Rhizobium leguminosarum]
MTDYTYQYKVPLQTGDLSNQNWDLFISAFSTAERVAGVFDRVIASRKDWLVHNEYGFEQAVIPSGAFQCNSLREDDYIMEYFEGLDGFDYLSSRICVDVTGFMRPHMMYIVNYLKIKGVKKLDVIYTEPGHYSSLDQTLFSSEHVYEVRQVAGYEGFSNNDTANDFLVVAAGYENRLISEVAEEKEKASKAVILGLPSLQADMYQQNALRAHAAADSLGDIKRRIFAPANDPFATATILSQLIKDEEASQPITNLFLSPLSTKAQALGFSLFFLRECLHRPATIIYPFSRSYSPDSSSRIGRIWKYCLELD